MALKRVRHTVNVPPEIEALVQKRKSEEKYRSVSDYFVSLAVFDIYARRRHILTAQLMNEPREIQDKVFAELRDMFDLPDVKPGSWFEHRIEELINERRIVAEIETDFEGLVTNVNRQFTQMCGYTLKEMMGKKPGEVLRPRTLKNERAIVERLRRSIRDRKPFECILTNYDKAGAAYRVELKIEPTQKGFKAYQKRLSK